MEIIGIKDQTAHLLVGEATRPPEQKREKEEPVEKVEQIPPPETLKIVMKENDASLKAISERITQSLKSMGYSLQFVPDKESGVVVVKVLDEDGKVIRQIPSEVMVGLLSGDGNKGLILNKILT
jgi:uncharacterized FlaG/YvyC family protein